MNLSENEKAIEYWRAIKYDEKNFFFYNIKDKLFTFHSLFSLEDCEFFFVKIYFYLN